MKRWKPADLLCILLLEIVNFAVSADLNTYLGDYSTNESTSSSSLVSENNYYSYDIGDSFEEADDDEVAICTAEEGGHFSFKGQLPSRTALLHAVIAVTNAKQYLRVFTVIIHTWHSCACMATYSCNSRLSNQHLGILNRFSSTLGVQEAVDYIR